MNPTEQRIGPALPVCGNTCDCFVRPSNWQGEFRGECKAARQPFNQLGIGWSEMQRIASLEARVTALEVIQRKDGNGSNL